MQRMVGVMVGLAIGLGALGAVAPESAAAPGATPPAQDAAHGRELFVRNGCYECHGYNGQGASGTGPRLAPNPIAFNRFIGIVYDPLDLMPRYSPEFVSEDDVRDIHAYLQTIPPAPSPADIPLLSE